VDLERFELSTSSMPWKRAPNCATGPGSETLRPENITVAVLSVAVLPWPSVFNARKIILRFFRLTY
jgi:hypothetical protein